MRRPRSMRVRILLAVVVATTVLLALVLAYAAFVMVPRHLDMDSRLAERQREAVRAAIDFRLEAMRRVARDWAVWDAMDDWLRRPEENTFVRQNLRPANLVSIGFSSMFLYDSAGRELCSLHVGAIPPELRRWGRDRARSWSGRRDTFSRTGATYMAGCHWEVCFQPVRRMDPSLPPSGVLIGVVRLDSLSVSAEGARIVAGSCRAETTPDSMFLPIPVREMEGLPRPRYSLHRARELWREGRDTLAWGGGGGAVFAVAFMFAMFCYMDKILVRRLKRLQGDLAKVQASPEEGLRVRGDGTGDDLDRFADQLNATLVSLEDSRRHLADAQMIAKLGFWHLDLDSMQVSLSPEHVQTAGLALESGDLDLSFDDYLGRFVHPEDHDLLRSWADYAKMQAFHDVSREIEYRVIGASGDVRHLLASCRKRSGEERILFLVAQDVTERRRMQEELMRGALYDPLTGLPNRNLVLDRIRAELGQAGKAPCTLLVLDLDRFGMVNNTLGRDLGDGLLLGISVRLVGALPPGTTVGRMTHDEFAIILPRSEIVDFDRIAEQIRSLVRTPLPIQGKELVLTGSVGIATASGRDCSAEELVSRAESALLQASAKGGDAVSYFDEERSRQAKERVDLEMDLGKAVSNDQLELHYQPIMHLASGRLAGFEALVRWRHPQRGMLAPLMFIPIAERSGLIHEIGLWVMQEAMRKEASWQADRGSRAPFMSINLSVRQFRHDDLSDQIQAAVERTGVKPEGIKLEITESALSEDPQRVAALLENLCSTGLRFSLDDFGTGYSSLGYLSRFPVQTLKVDKSFVDELGRDEKKTRITSAIVTLAHTLGMDVVAEGIETEVQRDRLLALGCEYGQGYLFSRPLPDEQADAFLDRF